MKITKWMQGIVWWSWAICKQAVMSNVGFIPDLLMDSHIGDVVYGAFADIANLIGRLCSANILRTIMYSKQYSNKALHLQYFQYWIFGGPWSLQPTKAWNSKQRLHV